ncbi:hypothetical protein [Andreprevotia lacus]|nr:hypothetical protein [Andreprevotia lacus]
MSTLLGREFRYDHSSPLADLPPDVARALQFWTIDDDDVLEDFLFSTLLADLHPASSDLPPGYAPLLAVLEFERHCNFSGWLAVSNEGAEQMQCIVDSYRTLGLEDEAHALARVCDAWSHMDRGNEEAYFAQLEDVCARAYGAEPNATSDTRIRLKTIMAFVRRHPEQFASPLDAST